MKRNLSIETFSHAILHPITESKGETVFTEVADCLEALALHFEGDARMFLIARAFEARRMDGVYEKKSTPWAGR